MLTGGPIREQNSTIAHPTQSFRSIREQSARGFTKTLSIPPMNIIRVSKPKSPSLQHSAKTYVESKCVYSTSVYIFRH